MLYRIGNKFYDSSKVATKRTKVVDELNALQLDNEVQSNELSYKRKVENLKIKLDTIPLVDGGWTGWANCYELEDRAEKPRKSSFDDMPNDIPF